MRSEGEGPQPRYWITDREETHCRAEETLDKPAVTRGEGTRGAQETQDSVPGCRLIDICQSFCF